MASDPEPAPSPRDPWRGGRIALGVVLAVAIGTLATVAGCGAGRSGATNTKAVDAAIYAAVVLEVIGGGDAEEPALVFVRPDPGRVIDLEVQADVVRRLDEVAEVRFVDDADEVRLVDQPRQPVRDEAMVVTVGEVHRTGARAEVAVERYVDSRQVLDRCLSLRRAEGEWRVVDGVECVRPPT